VGLVCQTALAEEGELRACDTQQKLEQVIQSDGRFQPDGCRMVNVTRVRPVSAISACSISGQTPAESSAAYVRRLRRRAGGSNVPI
jgi:hypothetical protein